MERFMSANISMSFTWQCARSFPRMQSYRQMLGPCTELRASWIFCYLHCAGVLNYSGMDLNRRSTWRDSVPVVGTVNFFRMKWLWNM
ncbi:hypothetical protein KC19_4G197200 [Ceratodon purpureus]|uniref:Uncharacterized protein n=1 Tax=Ceratodon purpureus TaxID=3225 RepID=A0A8T0IAJ7_CERPU|nr:hypothetical protein KC19_4G197200 [Ceratodon purpureus]